MQVTRGGEQHGGVAVVPAAVHQALEARLVREVVLLLHRQRVHVGAQADRAAAAVGAPAHDSDHAGLADPRVVLDAEVGEALADDLGGAMLLEAELRVHVQVAAQRLELGVPALDVFDGAHCLHPCGFMVGVILRSSAGSVVA